MHAGLLLRQLRKQRAMTSMELARHVHMSQSKISRIETGFYKRAPRKEIESILTALQAPDDVRTEVRKQLDNHAPLFSYKLDNQNIPQNQRTFRRNLKSAEYLRYYEAATLPGLLQTPDYMNALFQLLDLDERARTEATRQRLLGQDILWERNRQFCFVLSQGTLYTAVAGPQAQLVQLGRLEQMARLPNIQLEIIPLEAGVQLPGFRMIVLIDSKAALIELGMGIENTRNFDEVAEYTRLFEQVREHADSGEDALALIRRAAAFFGAQIEHENLL